MVQNLTWLYAAGAAAVGLLLARWLLRAWRRSSSSIDALLASIDRPAITTRKPPPREEDLPAYAGIHWAAGGLAFLLIVIAVGNLGRSFA